MNLYFELSMHGYLLGSCLPALEGEVCEIWSNWEYAP